MAQKHNQYQERYTYINHFSQCPNCSGKLGPNDKDCPFCQVNLVGYNEKHNMANNMVDYANEMNDIVEKHNQLNEKIRKDNEKIEKKKNLKGKLIKFAICVLIIGILTTAIFTGIMTSIKNSKAKTYAEVRQYLESYISEKVYIDELDYEFNSTKELTDEYYDGMYAVNVGYDKKTNITILKEYFTPKDTDVTYEITHVVPDAVAQLPKIDLDYGEISYSGKYRFVDIDNTFFQAESNITPDRYILANHTEENGNFIEKLGIFDVQGTEISVYFISKDQTGYADLVIGVVQLEPRLMYISTVRVSDTEVGGNPVLDNLESYFYIMEE